MGLIKELLGCAELESVAHVGMEAHAVKVVVPRADVGHHEEAEEAIGQQHLALFVEARQVTGVVLLALVAVVLAPLEARRRERVGRERAAAGRERARDDDAPLRLPGLVVLQQARVEDDVGRRQLRRLGALRVQPAERLEVLEARVVGVVGDLQRQLHALLRAGLRHHGDAANLLDVRVVGRRDAVHEAGDLRAEVGDADEALQEVLGQNVREARLLDVVGRHKDVARAQMEVRGRDGSHAPIGLRREDLLLVVARGRDDDLVAVHVRRLGRDGRQLRRLARLLLLDLGDLLSLLRRRRNLGTENNVANLGLRQRVHVDVVLLAVVGENQVLERHLDLDPLLVAQGRPHVMRLRHRGLVGLENHLGLLVVDVERTHNEYQARERRVRRDRAQPIVIQVEETHLRLESIQDQVAKLFNLETSLEWELKFRTLQHNIREIQTYINQSINQSINPSISQSIHQSINQSINQSELVISHQRDK